jgi:hypothetical protein
MKKVLRITESELIKVVKKLIKEIDNGDLPDETLNVIDDESSKPRLQKAAAEAYMKMKEAAKNDKVIIKLTGSNSGYRSCGEPGDHLGGGKCKNGIFTQWCAWEMYKSGVGNKAADPTKGCKSNHGWGNAIDVSGTDAKKWVRENGKKYGWLWYTKDGGEGERIGEDWHFIFKGETPDDKIIPKNDYIDIENPKNLETVKKLENLKGTLKQLQRRY